MPNRNLKSEHANIYQVYVADYMIILMGDLLL